MAQDSNDNEASNEKAAYCQRIREHSEVVESLLAKDPGLDPADLFHILARLDMTPEERLALGLRRRIFGDPNYFRS